MPGGPAGNTIGEELSKGVLMAAGPFLVLGATGGQGGAVVSALLDRSLPVRGLVRDTSAPAAKRLAERGAEVVAGSLDDAESLAAAMGGASGAFALTTPFEAGPDAEIEQGRAIAAAAQRAELPHLVFSSVAAADQRTGVPHFDSKAVVEHELAAADVPRTVLGPTYFFDNALGGLDRIREGVLDLPLPPNLPLQQLARRDLGEFAAEVLLNPEPHLGHRIELASDEPTPTQMAAALSAVLGTPVRHEQPLVEHVENPDMQAMWRFLNGPGYRVDLSALHASHPQVRWTSFAQWAATAIGGPGLF